MRGVVTLGIEGGGEGQHVCGAKFHTEAAALTSLDRNRYRSFGQNSTSLIRQHGACQTGATFHRLWIKTSLCHDIPFRFGGVPPKKYRAF